MKYVLILLFVLLSYTANNKDYEHNFKFKKIKKPEIKAKVYSVDIDSTYFKQQQTKTGCYQACKQIVEHWIKRKKKRIKLNNRTKAIQVAIERNNKLVKLNDLTYLDSMLEMGIPVIVGVHHTFNYGYNEGTTDHFVVVVGKDTTGYKYFDVGKRLGHRTISYLNSQSRYDITTIRTYRVY